MFIFGAKAWWGGFSKPTLRCVPFSGGMLVCDCTQTRLGDFSNVLNASCVRGGWKLWLASTVVASALVSEGLAECDYL